MATSLTSATSAASTEFINETPPSFDFPKDFANQNHTLQTVVQQLTDILDRKITDKDKLELLHDKAYELFAGKIPVTFGSNHYQIL